jgi:hypothetical protein
VKEIKMFATQYEEHLASQPDNSRWDGFDRGDAGREEDLDQGSRVIGRMASGGGYRVQITEFWYSGNTDFEVSVDGRRVHSTEDRANATVVARWWMDGCPV